jgi:hypothetical protein
MLRHPGVMTPADAQTLQCSSFRDPSLWSHVGVSLPQLRTSENESYALKLKVFKLVW